MKTRRVSLPLIRKVAEEIGHSFPVEKVILFGSYAHGRPNGDSDVDLLVVMKSKKRPVERAIAITKTLSEHPFPMDLLVRTPDEIRRRLRMGDSFYKEILSKGKNLYES